MLQGQVGFSLLVDFLSPCRIGRITALNIDFNALLLKQATTLRAPIRCRPLSRRIWLLSIYEVSKDAALVKDKMFYPNARGLQLTMSYKNEYFGPSVRSVHGQGASGPFLEPSPVHDRMHPLSRPQFLPGPGACSTHQSLSGRSKVSSTSRV